MFDCHIKLTNIVNPIRTVLHYTINVSVKSEVSYQSFAVSHGLISNLHNNLNVKDDESQGRNIILYQDDTTFLNIFSMLTKEKNPSESYNTTQYFLF